MNVQIVSLFVLLSIPCAPALAQSPTTVPDAQSTYEPRSDPGEGQKFLLQLVGDWKVVKTFYPASGGSVATTGQCRQTMINDGRFLQSDFVFGSGNDDTTGIGIIGFDPQSGRFTSVWADSRSTRMSFRQSIDKFDGKQIILYSRSLNPPASGVSHTSRTVTHLEDNGMTLIHRQYVQMKNGYERLVLQLTMTRQQPSTMP